MRHHRGHTRGCSTPALPAHAGSDQRHGRAAPAATRGDGATIPLHWQHSLHLPEPAYFGVQPSESTVRLLPLLDGHGRVKMQAGPRRNVPPVLVRVRNPLFFLLWVPHTSPSGWEAVPLGGAL